MTTIPENNTPDAETFDAEDAPRGREDILADIEKVEAEINRPDPIRLLDDLRIELANYDNTNTTPDTI